MLRVVDDELSCISNVLELELTATYQDEDYVIGLMISRSNVTLKARANVVITPAKWSMETEVMQSFQIETIGDFLKKTKEGEIIVIELSRRYFIFQPEMETWLEIDREDTLGFMSKQDYMSTIMMFLNPLRWTATTTLLFTRPKPSSTWVCHRP